MDRKQWIKVGLEIADHLEEIQRIVSRNGMSTVCMGVCLDGYVHATYIDPGETHWGITRMKKGEAITLEEGLEEYYTRS